MPPGGMNGNWHLNGPQAALSGLWRLSGSPASLSGFWRLLSAAQRVLAGLEYLNYQGGPCRVQGALTAGCAHITQHGRRRTELTALNGFLNGIPAYGHYKLWQVFPGGALFLHQQIQAALECLCRFRTLAILSLNGQTHLYFGVAIAQHVIGGGYLLR